MEFLKEMILVWLGLNVLIQFYNAGRGNYTPKPVTHGTASSLLIALIYIIIIIAIYLWA